MKRPTVAGVPKFVSGRSRPAVPMNSAFLTYFAVLDSLGHDSSTLDPLHFRATCLSSPYGLLHRLEEHLSGSKVVLRA